MSEPTPTRPRQVTMAGWLIMVGSVFALGLVVERLGGLHTLETQESVNDFLSTSPGSGLGVGADTVVSAIRTLAMVTAGCATAAAILGFHVLRRSRSARIAVTVLAVPIFFAGMVTGGFVTSVVAASAAILWLQPARSWFDGTTPPPPRRTAEATAPVADPWLTTSSVVDAPPPTTPTTPFATGPAETGRPATRPGVVLAACVVTWICAAFVTLGLIASGVALAMSPDLMLDQVHQDNPDLAAQGISDDLLMVTTYVMIAGLVAWCAAAAVLALLVLRGIAWARIVLIVSAATSAVCCLVGCALGAVLLVAPLLASVFVIAMLVRPDARPWFVVRRGSP